jgi:hypothetical protein
MAGAEDSLYEVEEMLVQPGTYFNPQTEVVVVVDDSASPDQEAFEDLEGYGGTEWVRISDDVAVDEEGRDRALEAFEARKQAGGGPLAEDALEASEDDFEEEEERPEPDPEPEE